jgi:hypothetical protein
MAPTTASAGENDDGWRTFDSFLNDDGSVDVYRVSKTDKDYFSIIHYSADGRSMSIYYLHGDAGPDGTTQRIDKPDVGDLIKKGLVKIVNVRANPEDTPLGQWIDREGHGFVPHWNNDSDKGPGQAPKDNTGGGLTPKQLAEITKLVNFTAKSLAEIGGSMGDGYEGLAGEDKPTPNKNNGGRGKGTGLGDGSGNYKNTHIGSGEAATLGPRPDLVNPAPKSKTGGSNLFAPGLLDTNAGLPGSGPAATGTPSRGIAPGTNLR